MNAPARERRRRSASLARSETQGAPTLPAWKAFTVQFSTETSAACGVFSGRVEHLNSGRRARFVSKQELLAVLERMLDDIEEPAR